MGGVCSRKRDNQVNENGVRMGVSRRYHKNGSSKWLLGTPYFRTTSSSQLEEPNFPSLIELCIHKICQDINNYSSFLALPRDISQQIFDKLICSHRLNDVSLEAFRDCALEDIYLGDYPGVDDSWVDVISSQGSSLLSVDLSGSDVTDSGLALLKGCSNLQSLTFDYCDHISEDGLGYISGLSNLASLSFRRSYAATFEGMRALSGLVNLMELDLERCSGVHGGFVHLKGLTKLRTLNVRYCKCITDTDMKAISEVTSLRELQVSCSGITDVGVSHLKALQNLILLNLEGCQLSAACLDSISALVALSYLNLSRCGLSDDGFDKISGLKSLKVLNLAFNNITDACLKYLKGLSNLETLNLDSCRIRDDGLSNLAGLVQLKHLELSDTEVGSSGLQYLSGLVHLESINLSFTLVNDSGLKKLSGLQSLKSLNLDARYARQISDVGLADLTSLTGLTHLDLFGVRISDSGTQYLRHFKNMQSLEICGGGLTDDGVKNIKDLTALTHLNLSQNSSLTDKTLQFVSGGTTRRSSHERKYKIEFHSEDSSYLPDNEQESVFMPNTNGKSYICFLPMVEKAKTAEKPIAQHNISSMIMESEKHVKPKTPDELLQVMEDHCFLRQESWWTYEFCHKKHMRQFHLEDKKVVEEYFLGYYDPEATAAYKQNVSDVSILKDPRSKDASQRYHAHQFTNGTNCDLTDEPRETEVRFVCSEGRAMIASITELSTCKYALTVQSPMLCTHPLFQEERPVWHTIHCNLLREDSKEMKDDEQKNKHIKMVGDVEFPFSINANEHEA